MKIVSRTQVFILIFLAFLFTPHISSALIIQGAIGVSLFNAFTTLFLFLFLPIAISGVLFRTLGMNKTKDGRHWKLNTKRLLLLFIKYIIYHTILVIAWFSIFRLLTGDYFLSMNLPISANSPFIFNTYLAILAISGPYSVYAIGKLIKRSTFPPTRSNFFRLYVWNIVVFWIASLILGVPLF